MVILVKKHKRAIIVLFVFFLLVGYGLFKVQDIILSFNNQLSNESKKAMKEKLTLFQINEIVFSGKDLRDFNEQIVLDDFNYDNIEYYHYFNEKSKAPSDILVFKANLYASEGVSLEKIVKYYSANQEHKDEFTKVLKHGRYENKDAILVVDPNMNIAILNETHVLDVYFEPSDLVEIDENIPQITSEEGIFLRKDANKALKKMCKSLSYDFQSECADLIVTRAYLSHDQAHDLYLKNEKKANEYNVRAGRNEHRLGNSFDLKLKNKKVKTYLKSDQYQWLVANAAEYGFIFRYPLHSDSTNRGFYPYHLRYVGKKLAKDIKEKNWSMEDYYLYTFHDKEEKKNEE